MSNAVHRHSDGDTFPVVGLRTPAHWTRKELFHVCVFTHVASYVFWTAQEDNDRAAASSNVVDESLRATV